MRYNKLKAFTLAELLILLLTLSIIMAAFAPVFTRRYNNVSDDDVWTFVSSDDDGDAYYDTVNKSYTSQAFIGLTPADQSVVKRMITDNGSVLYSKLIIAAGNSVKYGGVDKKQNQILFRYATSQTDKAGTAVGALFADGSNFMLGGLYNSKVSTGYSNTSYGVKTLPALTSGYANTAVGYSALYKLTTGSYNTAVGKNAAYNLVNKNYNTVVGTNAFSNTGISNTVIGFDAMANGSGAAEQNTIVGYHSGYNISTGSGNVAVGPHSLAALTTGYYNTAVGYNTLTNLVSGSYNTAVGAYSCNSDDLTANNYKTCIGYNSGNTGLAKLYNTNDERVFIGGAPAESVDGSGAPAAVLEVHNLNSTSEAAPIPYLGNSSVVINGNLIVRGNSYFETPLKRPGNMYTAKNASGNLSYEARIPKGLVLYRLGTQTFDVKNGKAYVFHAFDGMQRTEYSWETCRGGCGRGAHAFKDVRTNCICTGVNEQTFDVTSSSYTVGRARTHFDTTYDRFDTTKVINGSTSYDWASKTFATSKAKIDVRSPYNGTAKLYPSYHDGNSVSCNNFYDRNGDSQGATHYNIEYNVDPDWIDAQTNRSTPYVNNGAYYKDRSFDKFIYLERRPTRCKGGYDNDVNCRDYEYGLKGTDKPYAHMRIENQVGGANMTASCCPILTNDTSDSSPYKDLHAKPGETFQLSDKRLKDIGGKFTAGLDEIRKLNVYNYTFKTDKNQVPQVGVIAQDLRLVFPNAVEKDKNGYYQIRWDEMFYAAINSIKTLYTKAANLVAKVENDKQRVSNLKAENAELNAKLDSLEKEITKLETDN